MYESAMQYELCATFTEERILVAPKGRGCFTFERIEVLNFLCVLASLREKGFLRSGTPAAKPGKTCRAKAAKAAKETQIQNLPQGTEFWSHSEDRACFTFESGHSSP